MTICNCPRPLFVMEAKLNCDAQAVFIFYRMYHMLIIWIRAIPDAFRYVILSHLRSMGPVVLQISYSLSSQDIIKRFCIVILNNKVLIVDFHYCKNFKAYNQTMSQYNVLSKVIAETLYLQLTSQTRSNIITMILWC